MARNPRNVMRIASPVRAWTQRFTYVLLVGGAFALMMLGKTDAVLVERLRTHVTDALAPIMAAISQPVDAVERAVENAKHLIELRSQNAELVAERDALLQWQAVARKLEAENSQLRAMLGMVPDPQTTFVTAHVVGNSAGVFVREVLIAAGARDGILKGQAALTGDGLAGRITEVGDRSARVLLLTDINSRIPVLLESARHRAILAGDNSNEPRLLYLPPGAEPMPGDRIVTSGDGGVFPAGLPIGVIGTVEEGVVTVLPFVDWDRVEYLRIVNYELAGVIAADKPDGDTGGGDAR
ncbi:MAG: rod shape-determining protein MreC [Rhodospirillaceae bacterium]|nr:rod shape-determining protein MreC [Rhodospirillaceae bacterium]